MGEQTPADRQALREQLVNDWLRVTQRQLYVEEVRYAFSIQHDTRNLSPVEDSIEETNEEI